MVDETKNPRLTGNRGFFENSMSFRLEISSRNAGQPGDDVPNAHHLAIAAHGAQTQIEQSVLFHFKAA